MSDVGVSFHNITWHSTSRPGLVQHDPSVNLLCSFTPSADDTLLYHIDWYVDNDTVIQGQTVDKNSLQDAIMSAKDMHKAGKKINCWVFYIFKIVHLNFTVTTKIYIFTTRRGNVEVEHSPLMREIGVRYPVATDLSRKHR